MSERELPNGWAEATVGHLCELINGSAFKPSDWSTEGKPIIRIQNLNNPDATFNYYKGTLQEKYHVDSGELLFAWSGTPGTSFGAHIWNGPPSWLNQHIFRVLFNEAYLYKPFLKLALNQRLDDIIDRAHGGVGLRHITKGKFEETTLAVPPLNEQRRIADRIDALQARSRRAREALTEAQTLLEQFRQSVLSAAFRGDLTAKWREEHPDAEPASELLKRIRIERRNRWEKVELAKYAAKGKTPPPGWQKKYPEPVPVDTEGLPELPPGWCWASLDEILLDIEAGKNFKCVETPPLEGEWGIVKVSAVTWGIFQEDESKTITNDELVNYSLQIKEGDFLFSRANTIELVGASVIVNEILKNLILSDKILRFIFAFDLRHWVNFFLKSKEGRRQIEGRSSGNQASMRNISQENIARLPIPLASEHEMLYLVEKVAATLKKYEMTSTDIESQANSISVLNQSILAKAFRGELVPQDPDDEPAAMLLERILSEATTGRDAKKRHSRGKS